MHFGAAAAASLVSAPYPVTSLSSHLKPQQQQQHYTPRPLERDRERRAVHWIRWVWCFLFVCLFVCTQTLAAMWCSLSPDVDDPLDEQQHKLAVAVVRTYEVYSWRFASHVDGQLSLLVAPSFHMEICLSSQVTSICARAYLFIYLFTSVGTTRGQGIIRVVDVVVATFFWHFHF